MLCMHAYIYIYAICVKYKKVIMCKYKNIIYIYINVIHVIHVIYIYKCFIPIYVTYIYIY